MSGAKGWALVLVFFLASPAVAETLTPEQAIRFRRASGLAFSPDGKQLVCAVSGFENGKFVKSKEPAPEEKQRAFALATKPDGSYANAGNAKIPLPTV